VKSGKISGGKKILADILYITKKAAAAAAASNKKYQL